MGGVRKGREVNRFPDNTGCVFLKKKGEGRRDKWHSGTPESGNDTWFRISGAGSGGDGTVVVQREVGETGQVRHLRLKAEGCTLCPVGGEGQGWGYSRE